VEFRILGPLEVLDGGRQIPLGGAKPRSLLALLLLARGRPVSTERLIEDIWDGRRPDTAHKIVQLHVSSLRKALGEERISTVERGYVLHLEQGELDVERFEELADAASGAPPDEALKQLRAAFELVRGGPLDDLRLEAWVGPEVAQLEELVLSATEARIEAELALGRHRAVVRELERLVAAHPDREDLLRLLMLALYRCGRQTEALDAYRRASSRLRAELGLEPSPPLRQLERAILGHDPSLDLADPAGALAGAGAARRRPRWPLLVAGAALVAGVAIAAVLIRGDSGDEKSFASLPPGLTILDMPSGRVVATFPLEDFPFPGLNAQNGRFSIASVGITEIDPATGRKLRRIRSPLDESNNALALGRDMWFTGRRDLVRVDPDLSREVDRYRFVDRDYPMGLVGLAAGAGSLWVASKEAGEVLRVDPVNGHVQARIALKSPLSLAYAAGAVWAASDQGGLARIDASTNSVTATAAVPKPLFWVAAGGGFAWAANETKGTVYKVDQTGEIVATYRTGDGARSVSFANGVLWVANSDAGTMSAIDAASGAVRTYRFGHPLGDAVAVGRYVLVYIGDGLTVEDRISALPGKVAKLVIPIFTLDPTDPATAGEPVALEIERALTAGLLAHVTGAGLRPELAASIPTVSPDRRTYTFRLRRGLRFSPPSNARVTAEVVRDSVERALSPKLGSVRPGARFLRDLVGVPAYERGMREHISGVHVRGDTISFTLRTPSPTFLERISLSFFSPVPPGTPAIAGGVSAEAALASPGPYYVADRVNGEWAILRRNPNYRGPRTGALDAVALREGLDPEQAVSRVQRGEFDGLLLDDALLRPGGAVAHRFAGEPSSGAVTYRAFPTRTVRYLALNAGAGPLRDAALRHTLAAAIDRRALAVVQGATPSDELLPPEPASLGETRDSAPAVGLDPSARVRLSMAVQRGCDRCRQFAETVASALDALGLNVVVVAVEDPQAAIRAKRAKFDLVDLSTNVPYADPAAFLERMLGHDVPRAWLPALTQTAIARLDRLSGRRRKEATLRLAQRLQRTDVPVIAYGADAIGTLLGPRLGCRAWNGIDAGPELAALCLRSD
jgi:DNA-binding SARP family transcriptional activator/ABC-type oligopeptide transport system substrate-binding subunit/streptogramin lyase